MPREFPEFVDPWKAADGKRLFQGTIPLRWMRRLAPLLAPCGPDDESARAEPAEAGEAPGDAPDRTSGAAWPDATFSERVRRQSLLSVVESVAAQDGLPEHYEPILADHGRIALVTMVEDELLLAVPQVPRNPEVGEVLVSTGGASEAEDPPVKEDLQRPFEGLAELLEKAARRN